MRKILVILFVGLVPSCKETPNQPQQPLSQIVASVHDVYQNQPLPGKQIVLLPPGDTLLTDSNGQVTFSLPAGHYIIRALKLQGPWFYHDAEDTVDTRVGETTNVNFTNCSLCM